MADNFSDYLELKVLEHVTGRTTYTKPTNTYAALFTVMPTDAGGGSEVAAGSGYARQQLTWGAASSGTIANSADFRFPAGVSNATGTWGTIVALGVFDQLTSGNLLIYGRLSANVIIDSGDAFKIVAGGLVVSLS